MANTIESVLSDALLHQRLASGRVAYVDCDSKQNVFVSSLPAMPLELRNSIVNADGLFQKINADYDVVSA